MILLLRHCLVQIIDEPFLEDVRILGLVAVEVTDKPHRRVLVVGASRGRDMGSESVPGLSVKPFLRWILLIIRICKGGVNVYGSFSGRSLIHLLDRRVLWGCSGCSIS